MREVSKPQKAVKKCPRDRTHVHSKVLVPMHDPCDTVWDLGVSFPPFNSLSLSREWALPILATHLLMRSPNPHLGNYISQNYSWKHAQKDVGKAQTAVTFWFGLNKGISILNATV